MTTKLSNQVNPTAKSKKSKATIIFAPDTTTTPVGKTVFLAGTIDQGKSHNWQADAMKYFDDHKITLYNPRRPDYDPTWPQDPAFPQFYDQVTWELAALENVDIIMMFIGGGSESPITLLELGLFAQESPKRLIVCCEPGFWRRGNVQITCWRYGVELVESFGDLLKATERRLRAA